MKLFDIIQRATDFGTFRSRKNFFSFALKCTFYIIPAIVIGNYTDIAIQDLKNNNDYNLIYFILIQTSIIITTLYIILKLLSEYTSEFQITVAGGFFGVLYFGLQPNYINMIQEYLNTKIIYY
jgi:hypothetical protein